MSFTDKFGNAFESLRASHESGRLAHSYLICGSPRGEGLSFAEAMIHLVLGTNAGQVHQHPDVLWIEPEKKSRIISIEQVRDANKVLSQKSFEGGWKCAVFLSADRMNDAASNALLKTLEEPSRRTLLLLVTDAPQALLATISSRCQKITLDAGESVPQGPWLAPLMEALRSTAGGSGSQAMAQAAQIKRILDSERKRLAGEDTEVEGEEPDREVLDARVEARVKQVRSDIFHVITLWRRDILLMAMGADQSLLMFPEEMASLRRVMAGLTPEMAMSKLDAMADAVRRLDRNLPDLLALESVCTATGHR